MIARIGELAAGLPPIVVLGLAVYGGWVLLCAGWLAILAGVLTIAVTTGWGWAPDDAILAALGVMAVTYIGVCLFDPRTPCWWCRGVAKRFNSEGHFHLCWICGGSGQRRRMGAKILARHRTDRGD